MQVDECKILAKSMKHIIPSLNVLINVELCFENSFCYVESFRQVYNGAPGGRRARGIAVGPRGYYHSTCSMKGDGWWTTDKGEGRTGVEVEIVS